MSGKNATVADLPFGGYCDADQFRRACSNFPTGVTATTAMDPSGAPRGVTVASFTSVSLNPPMVLVCIDHRSRMLKYLSIDGHFGINILSEQQRDLSELLSRNWDERFSGLEWRPGHTGVPLLTGVAAAMECVITDMIPAGDHTVVFGRVLHAIRAEDSPLVYANRSYGRIAPLPIA